MPYTNHWHPHGLYRKFFGIVSGEEIMKSNFELHLDQRFSTVNYVINDFTNISGHEVDVEHTYGLATSDQVISNTKGRLKIAIVTTDEKVHPIAEAYINAMQDSLFHCRLFDTLEQAESWVSDTSNAINSK